MEISDPLTPKPRNFYDGGTDTVGPDRGEDPRIQLERVVVDGMEQFTMARRIAYDDREVGELLVPDDLTTFQTDLTSVPALMTWLVPKTGEHLPAALLHDGLIASADEERRGIRTYRSTNNVTVNRVEADRIFRDAMADRGTGLVRRWLIWSAVTLGTMFSNNDVGMSRARQWRYRIAIAGSLLVVVYVGLCATLALFDAQWPGFVGVPWMDDRRWYYRLLGGAGGAITVPFVLGFTWGRFRVAGWVGGIAVSLLIHVMIFLLLLTLLYQVSEWLTRKAPRAALGIFAGVLVAAVVVFLWMTFRQR
jgi:hypothetical protein